MAKQTKSAAGTIDAYLAPLAPDKRAALEALRATIHSAAPGAEEAISYGMPALHVDGRGLVAFGAAAKHCALYPMSDSVLASFAEELSGYSTSKGTIRFDPATPLPNALVRRIVKARLAEVRAETKLGKDGPAKTGSATSGSATSGPAKAANGVARGATVAKATAKSSSKAGSTSTAKPKAKFAAPLNDTTAVLDYLSQIPAVRRGALDELRRIVLASDRRVGEELKWNSPSFFVDDHFATFNLRRGPHADPNDKGVRLILHTGARAKGRVVKGALRSSPEWLEWLAPDRAMVDFADAAQIRARAAALRMLLRAWLEHVAR
jgi:uncharacterized protein YdhG (YjbR/CyaY superfamily)